MSSLKLYGSTSGYVEIVPEVAAGNNSVTLPNTTGSIAVKDASGNLEVGTGVTVSSPSSNTFAVSTNGSERVRVDSSGNVGIGTTIPQYNLDVLGDINFTGTFRQNGEQFVASRWTAGIGDDIYRLNGNIGIGTDNPTVFGTAYRTLQLNPAAGTGDGSAIRFMYDGGTANTNDLVIYTNTAQSYIRANGARNLDIMRNGSTVATFNANGIALPSGLGIDFSATANSSGTMSSELLDDYEEGTFTASWCNASGSAYGTITYDTRIGMYTKIGNVVYYDIHLVTSSWGGTTGTAWVAGLPYAATSARYQLGGGGIFCVTGVDGASAISNLTTQIASSGTVVELYYQTASTGGNFQVFGTGDMNETGSVSIRIGGFYFTNT